MGRTSTAIHPGVTLKKIKSKAPDGQVRIYQTWIAQGCINGVKYYIGCSSDINKAAAMYDDWYKRTELLREKYA